MSALVCDFDFDIFAVSETWLQPGTPSDNFLIPGYTMLRNDRTTAIVGGGVALYIKEGIAYEQYQLLGELDPGIETLCVVVKIKGQRLGLCVVYRPPSTRYTHLSILFQSLFVNLAIEVNSVLCLGDLNVDMTMKNSTETKYLSRLLKESNAIQIINEPTRVTATSATLLDHIIVDKAAEVKRIGVIDSSGITDHRGVKITDHKLVYCTLAVEKMKKDSKIITYRDYSKFNIHEAVKKVQETDWNQASNYQNVDEIECFITSEIKKIYDEQAPIVSKRVTRKRAPWKNSTINEKLKIKMKLQRKYWKTRSSDDWERFKAIRNELNNLIWHAKKSYFRVKLGASKDPKELWTCLKRCDILNEEYRGIPDGLNVDELNTFFVNMGRGCDASENIIEHFRSSKRNDNDGNFSFLPVTEDEVKSAINEIKSNAVGSDTISIMMVKAVSPYALPALTHLVNTSLESGIFPLSWKMSIVLPLGKKSAPKCVQDFRPISILPAISKILEKIVLRQMMPFINEENILPKIQSGFRKSHSTCTALVNLFSDLIDAKDEGKYSTMVMLDYSQAFDSMNHNLLAAKMSYYGFSTKSIEWVMSYLKDRFQVTKVGNKTSAPLVRDRGVPQGSCLGPVLFNIYTSDFRKCVKNCTVHQYADDCQLHLPYEPKAADEAISFVNSDLDSISRWSIGNGLKLNVAKCSVLHLSPQNVVQTLGDVVLEGESLTVSDTVKTLGVVLDGELTFSEHVTHSIQRAIGRLRGLYRYRGLLPETVKLQLMQSLVLSVFYYCYPAYGNSISREDVTRIQRVQNAAVRFVFSLGRFDHVSSHRNEAKLLPMETICRVLTSCMTHKALTLGQPQYLCERLLSRDMISQRKTRHDTILHFRRVRLELGRRSFSYFGPRMYNDLPECLKNTHSTQGFKKKIKVYFKDE